MSMQSCCAGVGHSGCVQRGRRRARSAAEWGAPALVLALVPKCPMCVAAYLALATGLEISIGAAAWLRAAVIAACALTLGLLALRSIRSRIATR